MQIKTILSVYLSQSEWLSSGKQITNNGEEREGEEEPLHTVSENVH
jgi:hypothetical protein